MARNKKASIVTGLLYGDEGKGLVVNELSKKVKEGDGIVVRHSGGSQAGHTVYHDGERHIFSNFGSGTLQGLPSYFTFHTQIDPNAIVKEYGVLRNLGVKPHISVHPMAEIITPYDIHANRNCEKNMKDGSCGRGIYKTVKRNKDGVKLHAIDLLFKPVLVQKMESIRDYYKNTFKTVQIEAQIQGDLLDFYDSCQLLLEESFFSVRVLDHLNDFGRIIFEGSQGLLLDQEHGVYPHMTPSYTSPRNALEVCQSLGLDDIEFFGVTRAYLTRHGNGPWERVELALKDTQFETNVHNDRQGEFKVAPMSMKLLNYAVNMYRIYTYGYPMNLMVTCVNQVMTPPNYTKIRALDQFKTVQESESPYGEFKTVMKYGK